MVKVIKRVERKRTYNLNCGVCYATLEYEYEDIKTSHEGCHVYRHIVCPDCGVSIAVNE